MNENKVIRNFTDIIAWKKGHAFVLNIYKLTKSFPGEERFGLTSQLQRAAVSITSNIAEGFSRKSNKEKVQFYHLSLSSLTEVQNQLLLARDLGYTSKKEFKTIAGQSVEVAKLINGLISATKKSKNLNSRLKTLDSKLFILSSGILPLLSIIAMLFLLLPTPTYAQDLPDNERVSFGVSTDRIVTSLVAGDSAAEEIKIYNLKNTEVEYLLSIEKFTADEQGDLKFESITPRDKDPKIRFETSQIAIPANSNKTITVFIDTNKATETKEHYFVIFITPIPTAVANVASASQVQGKIGILTFINVAETGEILGELVASGSIVEFNTSGINLHSPVKFNAVINNTGVVHYDAYGTLKIYNSTGSLTKTIELRKSTVLPGANRILEGAQEKELLWDFGFRIGKYRAELDVKSTDGTLELTEFKEFYVIPLIPILVGFGIIIVFGLVVVARRRIAKKVTT